jgi:hypothetical protein
MSLTKKDIIDYKTTQEASLKHEIEMKVIDDVFERDALEGWSSPEVGVNQLKKLKRQNKWRVRNKVVLSSATVIIFSVILIFIFFENRKSIEEKSFVKRNVNKIDQSTISKDSITRFQELPEKLQIKSSKIISDFAEKKEFIPTKNTEEKEMNSEPIRLPLKEIEKIKNSNLKRENIAKETFLHDLKVIDYRFYRSRPNERDQNELGGTPADKEAIKTEYSQNQTSIEYTYYSYLDKTMNYFKKNKFKEALNRFEVILETYPDDVNALFYSGICHYNLNRFDICEKRLIQLQNSRFTNFDQEQQWYLLLTYKLMGKKTLFDQMKDKIIQENGFYSKSAKGIDF